MYPSTGETVKCKFCGKRLVASRDMEYWFSLSKVKAEETAHSVYFCPECATKCLDTFFHSIGMDGKMVAQIKWIDLNIQSPKEDEIEKQYEKMFSLFGLLGKISAHPVSGTCPLCEKSINDSAHVGFKGKKIHSRCLETCCRH